MLSASASISKSAIVKAPLRPLSASDSETKLWVELKNILYLDSFSLFFDYLLSRRCSYGYENRIW